MYEKEKGLINKASWLKKAIITLYALVKRQGTQQGAYYSRKQAMEKLERLMSEAEELLDKAIKNTELDLYVRLDKIADEFVEVWVGSAYDIVPIEDTLESLMKSQAL